jgi:hypothetical protein
MANRGKYPPLQQLRGESYEIAESREPGEPVRKIGIVKIDRNVFKKTDHEKAILKLAKAQEKLESLKK